MSKDQESKNPKNVKRENHDKFERSQENINERLKKFVSDSSKAPELENKKSNLENLIGNNQTLQQNLFQKGSGEAKKIQKTEEYQKLILNLNAIRDARKGVIWTIDEESKLLIRDARNPEHSENPEKRLDLGLSESYKIQILNAARAAEMMIFSETESGEISGDREKLIEEIREKVNGYISDPNKILTIQDVRSFNGELVDFVCKDFEISEKEASRRLNIAKEYTSFDDEHYSVSTIYEIEEDGGAKKQFIETDVALIGLTLEQEKKFGKMDIFNEISVEKQPWFLNLDSFRQKMILFQRDKILKGEHVCPTQLRELPLIRNGFKKIVSEVANTAIEDIASHVHTGTHYVDAKHDDTRKQMMDMVNMQQSQFRDKGAFGITCDLLSPTLITPADKKMSKNVKNINENDHFHINLSQNLARIFVLKENKPLDEIFKRIFRDVDRKEQEGLESLIKCLENGKISDEKKLKSQIENLIKDPVEKEIFNIMLDIRILSNNITIIDLENKNLQVAGKLEDLANNLKKLDGVVSKLNDDEKASMVFGKKVPKFEIVMQCKSGKDRTGVVELYNLARDIVGKLKGINVDKVLGKISDLSNSTFLPGFEGGTPGCSGIKKEASTVLPWSSRPITNLVIQATASDNAFRYDKSKISPEAKKFNNKSQKKALANQSEAGKEESRETSVLTLQQMLTPEMIEILSEESLKKRNEEAASGSKKIKSKVESTGAEESQKTGRVLAENIDEALEDSKKESPDDLVSSEGQSLDEKLESSASEPSTSGLQDNLTEKRHLEEEEYSEKAEVIEKEEDIEEIGGSDSTNDQLGEVSVNQRVASSEGDISAQNERLSDNKIKTSGEKEAGIVKKSSKAEEEKNSSRSGMIAAGAGGATCGVILGYGVITLLLGGLSGGAIIPILIGGYGLFRCIGIFTEKLADYKEAQDKETREIKAKEPKQKTLEMSKEKDKGKGKDKDQEQDQNQEKGQQKSEVKSETKAKGARGSSSSSSYYTPSSSAPNQSQTRNSESDKGNSL